MFDDVADESGHETDVGRLRESDEHLGRRNALQRTGSARFARESRSNQLSSGFRIQRHSYLLLQCWVRGNFFFFARDPNTFFFWNLFLWNDVSHVLGAAMFAIEIDGTRILYTGDYSREEDRHLMAAELPAFSPDVLIVESTYGRQNHEPREAREKRFTEAGLYISLIFSWNSCVTLLCIQEFQNVFFVFVFVVTNIVSVRRGRCLLPVFALGRAQELLLILVLLLWFDSIRFDSMIFWLPLLENVKTFRFRRNIGQLIKSYMESKSIMPLH